MTNMKGTNMIQYNLTGYDNFNSPDIRELTDNEKKYVNTYADAILNDKEYDKDSSEYVIYNQDDPDNPIEMDDLLYSASRYAYIMWCCKRVFEWNAQMNNKPLPVNVQALICEQVVDKVNEKILYTTGFDGYSPNGYDYYVIDSIITMIQNEIRDMLTIYTAFTGTDYYTEMIA